jgi:hypothetical protein
MSLPDLYLFAPVVTTLIAPTPVLFTDWESTTPALG